MNARTALSRLGALARGGLFAALLLFTVALPALTPAVGAAGCGACDDDGDGLTNDQEYAAKRQLFLTEQGYRYTILDASELLDRAASAAGNH